MATPLLQIIADLGLLLLSFYLQEVIKNIDQTIGFSSLIGKCFQGEVTINNKFTFLEFQLFLDVVLKVFI